MGEYVKENMNENMQKYLEKAQVLIEALPYIQRFNRKIIVVKYGGSAMVDESLKKRVIEDVTLLKLVGFKPIIVHGGGKEISKWVGKVGMEPQFINGLRDRCGHYGSGRDGTWQGKQKSGTDGRTAWCARDRNQRKRRGFTEGRQEICTGERHRICGRDKRSQCKNFV